MQFITSRTYETVLVIGAEKLSSIVNWKDRNTCVLFGDGAGAAILQNRSDSHGLLTAVMGADGRQGTLLSMPGGGSACPATPESVALGMHYLRMDGKETFKSAVNAMVSAANEAMRRCEITSPKSSASFPIKPTSASLARWASDWARRRSSCSSIFTSTAIPPPPRWRLPWMKRVSGRISRGDLILLVVFGAGLTWGAAVIEW